MSFKVPEKYRLKTCQMGSDESYGNNGGVIIPLIMEKQIRCIVSDGGGWEHVSVSVARHSPSNSHQIIETPDWIVLCKAKNLFWDEEDCVVQFHPPKSEYVNMHPNVLHLWRKVGEDFETPPKIMIGI